MKHLPIRQQQGDSREWWVSEGSTAKTPVMEIVYAHQEWERNRIGKLKQWCKSGSHARKDQL